MTTVGLPLADGVRKQGCAASLCSLTCSGGAPRQAPSVGWTGGARVASLGRRVQTAVLLEEDDLRLLSQVGYRGEM